MPVMIGWHPPVCRLLHHSPFIKIDLFLVAICDSLRDKITPSHAFHVHLFTLLIIMKAKIKFRQEEYHQMKNIQPNSSDTSDCDSIVGHI